MKKIDILHLIIWKTQRGAMSIFFLSLTNIMPLWGFQKGMVVWYYRYYTHLGFSVHNYIFLSNNLQ
jgi:hypothetical protein